MATVLPIVAFALRPRATGGRREKIRPPLMTRFHGSTPLGTRAERDGDVETRET